MQTSLLLAALCLFASVNLCRNQSNETTSGSTVATNVTSGPTTVVPATNHTEKPDTAPTEDPNSNQTTAAFTTAAPAPNKGLSGGAIAGIVIGTLAGVALLGGGVYGLLKYTDKI